MHDAKKLPKIRHLGTIAQLCRAVSLQLKHVLTIGKNLLNSNISWTCPHNMANSGPLAALIGSGVWGTPANFNGFRILPSLLQQRRSPEANQTFHDVWPSPGLVHYIYVFGGACPLTEFCPVQNWLYVHVLRSPILAVLLQGTPTAGVSQTLRRGTTNGNTEGLQTVPPIFGWASAHILVRLCCLAVGGCNNTPKTWQDERAEWRVEASLCGINHSLLQPNSLDTSCYQHMGHDVSSISRETKHIVIAKSVQPSCQFNQESNSTKNQTNARVQVAGSLLLDLNIETRIDLVDVEDRRFVFQVSQPSSKRY